MTNKNNMIITKGETVFEIDCDVDLNIPDDGKTYHVSEAVYAAALERPQQDTRGNLPAGKYNVRILAIVTSITGEETVEEDPQ